MSEPSLSILYVDDEPLLLNITKECLESWGFIVDTAESGKQALQKIEDTTFDAVVSDYLMPGMDGIELLKEIRGKNPDIPFILFTGRGREEVVIEAIENGADFYLQKGGKPVPQFIELSHKIRMAVQRRRDSRALRESELRFRSLIQNSSDIIRILDKDGIIIFDSPSSSTILGYPEGSLVGSEAFDYIHPADRERVRSDFQDVGNRCNTNIPTEYRIRKADGSYLYVDSIALNFIGVPGIDGIVTTTHPIHNLKMAEMELRTMADDLSAANEELTSREEELRENYIELTVHQQALAQSEERFRSMAERSSDLVLLFDHRLGVTYASPSSRIVLGYDPDELVGKTHEFATSEIFSQSDPDISNDARMALNGVITGKKVYTKEVWITKKDGTSAFVSICAVPMFHDGVLTGAQASIRDITRAKKMETALRKANRQLNLLSDITRHDILNNISVIYAYLELMETRVKYPDLKEYLRKMVTATNEIKSQIEFTQIYEEIGSQEPQWIPLETVMPFSSLPHTVTFETSLQGVSIFADPMLPKVFFALGDNSIRHGQHVTRILVSTSESADDLIVVWEDNGVGVADDEKERIFEQGFGKNTGIGMFLVREILSLTDITIRETGKEGVGVRFEIIVPKGAHRHQLHRES